MDNDSFDFDIKIIYNVRAEDVANCHKESLPYSPLGVCSLDRITKFYKLILDSKEFISLGAFSSDDTLMGALIVKKNSNPLYQAKLMISSGIILIKPILKRPKPWIYKLYKQFTISQTLKSFDFYIEALFIGDSYRNLGLASALIRHFIECDSNSARIIAVDTEKNNFSAQNFYSKLGFEMVLSKSDYLLYKFVKKS